MLLHFAFTSLRKTNRTFLFPACAPGELSEEGTQSADGKRDHSPATGIFSSAFLLEHPKAERAAPALHYGKSGNH